MGENTIGIEYDRKVRATLCCRVSPESRPYSGFNATNGISRAEHWPNIWISDPSQTLPQHLTLNWKSPQTISEIRLTFDTDLCAPDRCYGWPREAHRFVFPAPECVKDYRVVYRSGDNWKELLSVEDNYHRHCIHRLEISIETEELRVEVLNTHGANTVRIYEIRVY